MARRRTRKGCLEGRHVRSESKDALDGLHGEALTRACCRRCGFPLVKSPITGRWRATGLMG